MSTLSSAQIKPQPKGQAGVSHRRFSWAPYVFILPHLIFFMVFVVYPLFYGLYISLFNFNYLRPDTSPFVGLQNYTGLFNLNNVDAQLFWTSLWNTVQFVIYSVPLLVLIPLGLAVLLNSKTPGRNVFRAIYFAPWVLSVAVIGLLWWWIFQSQGGLLNYYLGVLGLPQPQWLSSLPWAWLAIVICTIWWTVGFNTIILLAALQDVPTFLYEAGAIDGANAWQAFRGITLPLLRPVLLFIVIISIISSFNLFGQPYIMTHGGPALANGGGATTPVMLQIFNQGFVRYYQGSASAMSFVVAAIMIVISYGNFRLFRQRD
jgi:multiple sugar transport system permease protein